LNFCQFLPLSQFIDEFEKGGATREERKIIDFFNELLELGGGGHNYCLCSPIPAEERPYLMLMSWASISSVVVMILELAW
jgi:hypothetical protein